MAFLVNVEQKYICVQWVRKQYIFFGKMIFSGIGLERTETTCYNIKIVQAIETEKQMYDKNEY